MNERNSHKTLNSSIITKSIFIIPIIVYSKALHVEKFQKCSQPTRRFNRYIANHKRSTFERVYEAIQNES